MPSDTNSLIQFEVEETKEGREFWLGKPWSNSVSDQEKSCSVLFIPWENFRGEAPLFPTGTSDIAEFLRANNLEDIGFAINEELYQEISLHANIMRIPIILCKYAALPMLLNLLSSNIDRWASANIDNSVVESQIIIEKPAGVPVRITYKGPAAQFSNFMAHIEQIERDENARRR